MFVGLVRDAMIGAGYSWKLSGGSQFSSAVTKVSKNRQVRRESCSRNARCTAERLTGGAASERHR